MTGSKQQCRTSCRRRRRRSRASGKSACCTTWRRARGVASPRTRLTGSPPTCSGPTSSISPFRLLYALDTTGAVAHLAGGSGGGESKGVPKPHRAVVAGSFRPPLLAVLQTSSRPTRPSSSTRVLRDWALPVGSWEARPERAMVLPLASAGHSQPFALLVAGIEPAPCSTSATARSSR